MKLRRREFLAALMFGGVLLGFGVASTHSLSVSSRRFPISPI